MPAFHPRISHQPLTVAQVMITPVVVLRRSATLAEALRTLREQGGTALVVAPQRQGEPFGIITRRALERPTAATTPASPLIDLMIVSPLVVTPAMRAEDCARLLLASGIHQVVVLHAGQPVGIVRASDIFQAIESRGNDKR